MDERVSLMFPKTDFIERNGPIVVIYGNRPVSSQKRTGGNNLVTLT
jgi:hypothetical protein